MNQPPVQKQSIHASSTTSISTRSSTSSSINLQNLLHQSRQLQGQLTTNQSTTTLNAPFSQPLKRSLDQVAHRSLALVERSVHNNSLRKPTYLDSSSQSFLASAGINTEQLKRDLDALDVSKTLEPIQPLPDSDYHTFLANVHDNTIWSLLEESRVKSEYDASTLTTQVINADWQLVKRAFFASLGLQKTSPPSFSQQQPQTKNPPEYSHQNPATPNPLFTPTPSASLMVNSRTSVKSANYLAVIRKTNLSPSPTNLVADLRHACSVTTHQQQVPVADQQLALLWDIMEGMLTPNAVDSLHYAHDYLYACTEQLPFVFLRRARGALEQHFLKHIEETVQRHPTAARAGGNPSTLRRVMAFARARHLKSGLRWDIPYVELVSTGQCDVPIWAVVYYLIRAGRVSDAVEFLKANSDGVGELDKYMFMYLVQFSDGTLDEHADMVVSLRNYYTQLVSQKSAAALANSSSNLFPTRAPDQNSMSMDMAVDGEGVDPFKFAIVKLLGKCDVGNRKIEHVVSATEDWLWVRLMLVSKHEYRPESLHAEILGMESVLAQQSPIRFAGFLLASGLFEHALAHLIKASSGQTSSLFIDTVHIAVALHHYGCLNIPTDPNNVLGMQVDMPQEHSSHVSSPMSGLSTLTGEKKSRTIPLHTLISKYLQSGAVSDPIDKLHYLARLPLYAVGSRRSEQSGTDLPNVWQAAFDLWLPYTNDQLGSWVMTHSQTIDIRIPPRILDMFKLASMDEFHKAITVPAANVARAQDILDRAVYLYAQGDEPSGVFDTLQIILIRAIVHGPGMLALGGRGGSTPVPVDVVLKQAEYVLDQFGVKRPLSEFGEPAAVLEPKRNASILLTRILEVKQVAAMPSEKDANVGSALNKLLELRIIPHDPKVVPESLECIQSLPVVAHGIVPVVLKLGMDLIVTYAKQSTTANMHHAPGFLGMNAQGGGHAADQLASLRTMALALRQLAGRVPFNMDASVHAYLARKVAELACF